MPSFYEFFAGGGMARAGLGVGWQCAFANDFDPAKAEIYRDNWGGDHFHAGDVCKVRPADLPGAADLVWASFPCQDLSLAGYYQGLKGERSGMFWPFWKLMEQLREEGRAPRIIAIENVCGVLTSSGGKDFQALAGAFANLGYRFGAVVIDARHFLPQSRPRFFLIGVRADLELPAEIIADAPTAWHPPRLVAAYAALPAHSKARWCWWDIPAPKSRKRSLASIIEDTPTLVQWHTPEETQRLITMMSDLNRKKLAAVQQLPGAHVGTIYKRTRLDAEGRKVQRAEVRFDNIAGCLRTPRGGSSRQTIMVVSGKTVRSRLLSPREAARLMGLPDTYRLPNRYTDAYQLSGDGVAVPVVAHLAATLFTPVLEQAAQRSRLAI